MDEIGLYVVDEEDLAYEYELQQNPQSLITWRRYLESWKSQGEDKRPSRHVIWLYERFCAQFLQDVEVWMDYIQWSLKKCGTDVGYKQVMGLFTRCLSNVSNRCEEVCSMFLEFAISQFDLGYIRKAFDLSLKKLPIGSHGRVWEKVLRFVDETLAPLTRDEELEEESLLEELSLIIYKDLFGSPSEENPQEIDRWSSFILRRYVEVCPQEQKPATIVRIAQTQDFQFLYDAFNRLFGDDHSFVPQSNLSFSTNLLYLKALDYMGDNEGYEHFLIELANVFPEKWVDVIIRLVKFYSRAGQHEKLIEVTENALVKTNRVQDFSVLYSAYVDYEKAFISTVLEELQNRPEIQATSNWRRQLEVHLCRLQGLLDSYEVRLNDIKIRRNPNSPSNWSERAALFVNTAQKSDVYSHAILTIDPHKVTTPGSFGKLWCEYATLYWDAKDYDNAREVFDRSLRVPYSFLQDLEEIWSVWAEYELEKGGLDPAIKLLGTALQVPQNPELLVKKFKDGDKKVPAQAVVFTSLKLWLLYLDFSESLAYDSPSHFEATVALYEQTIALKVATPLIFINYAHFLQEHGEILTSFQVYERAIAIFPPETQLEIWNLYLMESISEKSPLVQEQIRDLFDQALRNLVNGEIDCKNVFLLYSDFEEKSGMLKRCCEILLQGARKAFSVEDKVTLWQTCITKTKRLLGNEESRALYEESIRLLPNSRVIKFVIDFASTEAILGELERARELYRYGAQLLPPGRNIALWDSWDEFEVQNGDKESYKDMLKLRRKLEKEMRIETEAESQLEGNIAFVAASEKHTVNPDEIDLNI